MEWGGRAAGDEASRIARDQVVRSILSMQEGLTSQQAKAKIEELLIKANAAVYQRARAENSNMETTASVVYIWEGAGGERKAIIGNVGDSRVYLLRGGSLEQITLDDSRVRAAMPNEQAARQLQSKLNNVVDPQRELTDEERAFFKLRRETQGLGRRSVEPRIHSVDLQPADRLIVCSDGISDNLTNNEILAILNANQNNARAVQKLIVASQARNRTRHPRAKPDDMTVAIIGETGASSAGLENLNRPATIQDIPTADNLEELVAILQGIKGIQGSRRFYESTELLRRLKKVVAEEEPIESLTRAGGFRRKVADFMKVRKKI